MIRKKQCIAMLLAGGQGSRLGVLTSHMAKPAVPFGGKYRIIDFPLSNCANSGIDTVGVLTQYQPLELNAYIGSGAPWDLDVSNGGVYVLPPYHTGKTGEWYRGTANAIYQNLAFIEQFNPDYVLILSGDHIYKMDYNAMLRHHIQKNADVTIAVRQVPWEEASRFGIMNTDEQGTITEFEEKPAHSKSNNASMGVYIFRWDKLRDYLTRTGFTPAENTVSLQDAQVIVAGGKGVGSRRGFDKLFRLAALLGGAVGATRSAVDAGYIGYAHQIGQTGVTVRPRLYIVFGASGAIQHTVGMSAARTVIAVNRDRLAPIFRSADYGVAADWEETADAMISMLSQKA